MVMLSPRDQLHISIMLAVKLEFEILGCEFTQRQSTYMQLVNNQDTEVYIACKIKIQNVKLC